MQKIDKRSIIEGNGEMPVTEASSSEPDPVEAVEPAPPTLAEATAVLGDAQLRALTAEQARNDATAAIHLAEEKLATCDGELAELEEQTRTVDPDNSAALRKLSTGRATLQMKRDALAARSQRAQDALGEADTALAAAQTRLLEAEETHHAAQLAHAKQHLAQLVDAFNDAARADVELLQLGGSTPVMEQLQLSGPARRWGGDPWSPIESAANFYRHRLDEAEREKEWQESQRRADERAEREMARALREEKQRADREQAEREQAAARLQFQEQEFCSEIGLPP